MGPATPGHRLARLPVLIVGAGPVGAALALELGMRGVPCLVVEQTDGATADPRAITLNVRTAEFCRRWGVGDAVRAAGLPADYSHHVLYVTSLTGHEIARIERPTHGGGGASPASPENPQWCSQIWFTPILAKRAGGFPSVTMRTLCQFESFEEDADGIIAEVTDLESGRIERIAANYLVACCGGRSTIRDTLGIEMEGTPILGHQVQVFFRAEALWTQHDKGTAVLYFIVGPEGAWALIHPVDGKELWRLTFDRPPDTDSIDSLDIGAYMRRAFGAELACEVVSVSGWDRRELVARRFQHEPVFLAGDCAHMNAPSGGYGLNTGLGDAVDLGWKLAAMHEGWGGPDLLSSYEADRRPIATGIAAEATRNVAETKFFAPAVAEDTPEGERTRARLRAGYLKAAERRHQGYGIALGNRYEPSPICLPDGIDPPPDDPAKYRQSSYPGCRTPHAWLDDGRSTLDLFANGFTLLRLGADAPDCGVISVAAEERGVPVTVVEIDEPQICALYETKLVLVRPDGHVAWRGDAWPEDAAAVIDRARGAVGKRMGDRKARAETSSAGR